MKRSKLSNKTDQTKNPSEIKNYKKQSNYAVQLNKKSKLQYFNDFDLSQGNQSLWVKCKPYFSNKHSEVDANIAINEERDIIFLKKEIANTFHEYFGSVVESLSLDLHT